MDIGLFLNKLDETERQFLSIEDCQEAMTLFESGQLAFDDMPHWLNERIRENLQAMEESDA